jgi:hypothetical protein
MLVVQAAGLQLGWHRGQLMLDPGNATFDKLPIGFEPRNLPTYYSIIMNGLLNPHLAQEYSVTFRDLDCLSAQSNPVERHDMHTLRVGLHRMCLLVLLSSGSRKRTIEACSPNATSHVLVAALACLNSPIETGKLEGVGDFRGKPQRR